MWWTGPPPPDSLPRLFCWGPVWSATLSQDYGFHFSLGSIMTLCNHVHSFCNSLCAIAEPLWTHQPHQYSRCKLEHWFCPPIYSASFLVALFLAKTLIFPHQTTHLQFLNCTFHYLFSKADIYAFLHQSFASFRAPNCDLQFPISTCVIETDFFPSFLFPIFRHRILVTNPDSCSYLGRFWFSQGEWIGALFAPRSWLTKPKNSLWQTVCLN